jgi:hypothetical protein
MVDGAYQYLIRSKRLTCGDFLHYLLKAALRSAGRTTTVAVAPAHHAAA